MGHTISWRTDRNVLEWKGMSNLTVRLRPRIRSCFLLNWTCLQLRCGKPRSSASEVIWPPVWRDISGALPFIFCQSDLAFVYDWLQLTDLKLSIFYMFSLMYILFRSTEFKCVSEAIGSVAHVCIVDVYSLEWFNASGFAEPGWKYTEWHPISSAAWLNMTQFWRTSSESIRGR